MTYLISLNALLLNLFNKKSAKCLRKFLLNESIFGANICSNALIRLKYHSNPVFKLQNKKPGT